MSRRARFMIGAPVALVAIVVLFAGVGLVAGCGSSSGGSSSSSGSMQAANQGFAAPEPATGSGGAAATKSQAGGASSGQDFAAAIPPASAPSSHYLVRTGDLSLLVARGTLQSTVDRITSMTTAVNGYVMSSAVGSQDTGTATPEPMPLDTTVSSDGAKGSVSVAQGNPYASLVVRVPEQFFDAAIKRFSKLGDVQSVTTSSDDVTSQYVDLKARLTHYRAVERRLVVFLSQTTTVSQMLAIQDRIDKVQLTIEELTAQLKSMQETTTYGTLSVYVSEKDRTPVAIHAGSSFGGTLRNSIDLLGRGVRVTALVVTALLPWLVVFGVIGAVAWYIVRRVRRSRRQAAQPSLPT